MKHNATMYGPAESLARIDAIAAAALSGNSLAHYRAYKGALLARERDHEAIFSTLTLFVVDLFEANGRTAVISRDGNGT